MDFYHRGGGSEMGSTCPNQTIPFDNLRKDGWNLSQACGSVSVFRNETM